MITTIVIPTFNEVENIEALCLQIFNFCPYAKVIFVDDKSTDGTAELIKKMSATNKNIIGIFRAGPKNFAGSYIDGFKKALELNSDYVIQMDADGSHNPSYLPVIIENLKNYDVVIGSRYIKNGGVLNWSWKRQLLSKVGNLMAAFSTGIFFHDLTAGFVGWKKNILEKIPFEKIQINGYSFQIDLKHWAHGQGAKIKEVPIIFADRQKGVSKMNTKIVKEAILLCLKKIFLPKKISLNVSTEENKDFYRYTENYDWTRATDNIVGPETFFHRLRVKKILQLIKKYGHEEYLDVGCGTALITRRLPNGSYGLDINPRNLVKARAYAPQINFLEGDAENLPFKDSFFNTVIATEILEHLVPGPEKTLAEIKRVLKKNGALIGSVPSCGLIWKLRFLSRTHGKNEPYHHHFNKKEIQKLLNNYFTEIKIISDPAGMNWFFICR